MTYTDLGRYLAQVPIAGRGLGSSNVQEKIAPANWVHEELGPLVSCVFGTPRMIVL